MRRMVALIVVGILAAVTSSVLVWYRNLMRIAEPASGMLSNGMAYARVGTGPRTLLFLRGLPGVPFGRVQMALSIVFMRPLLEDGYTMWVVARKRGLPEGHTVADMAVDLAALIDDRFDGEVDLVIGEEAMGGMTAFYLATDHPDRFGHLVVMLAGHRMSEEGRAFEREFARLLSIGRRDEAGSLLVRTIAPHLRVPGIPRVLGALLVRFLLEDTYPGFAQDVMVEAEAVTAFDGRDILREIHAPILLIGCDRDFEFSKEVYKDTARLIPDCTLRLYEGKTGFQAASDKRLPLDVLHFVERASGAETVERASELSAEPIVAKA